jgi:hypothetical protein
MAGLGSRTGDKTCPSFAACASARNLALASNLPCVHSAQDSLVLISKTGNSSSWKEVVSSALSKTGNIRCVEMVRPCRQCSHRAPMMRRVLLFAPTSLQLLVRGSFSEVVPDFRRELTAPHLQTLTATPRDPYAPFEPDLMKPAMGRSVVASDIFFKLEPVNVVPSKRSQCWHTINRAL